MFPETRSLTESKEFHVLQVWNIPPWVEAETLGVMVPLGGG